MKTINMQRRSVVQLGAAAGLMAMGMSRFGLDNALAAEERIYTSEMNNEAVSGYDPVSFFTEGKPVKGILEFRLKHQGADWLFSSQENMDLFKSNTKKYSPQYGGHCAYNLGAGTGKGKAVRGNPLNFDIVNDKLYLNYDKYTQRLWHMNQSELIERGDDNWPTVFR